MYTVYIYFIIYICVYIYIYTYTYTPNSTCTCITFYLLSMPLRFLLSHQPGAAAKSFGSPQCCQKSESSPPTSSNLSRRFTQVGKVRPKIVRHSRWLECSQTFTCGTMWLRFTLIRTRTPCLNPNLCISLDISRTFMDNQSSFLGSLLQYAALSQ